MIVDSHQHFWQLANPFTDWPTPDLAPIHHDFGAGDLAPLLKARGIDATVLVQAAPAIEETHFLLEAASRAPFVRAVVGWVDLSRAEHVAQLPVLANHPLLRSIRPMLQGIADTEWILRPEVEPGLRALVELGLRFDALTQPRHLPVLKSLAQRHPDLPIVVDHASKPQIRNGLQATDGLAGWAPEMAALAACPNVVCKLSGLLTEAAPGADAADLKPYMDHLLASFGPERLMWGSDWPVVILGRETSRTAYTDWFDMVTGWLEGQSEAARAAILGGTACRFYGIAAG